MIIPKYLPDDIVDYIYSLILYEKPKVLLDDIKNYYSTIQKIKYLETLSYKFNDGTRAIIELKDEDAQFSSQLWKG